MVGINPLAMWWASIHHGLILDNTVCKKSDALHLDNPRERLKLVVNSLSAKSVLVGEKLVATYSIST
jgi:hypothetical protein